VSLPSVVQPALLGKINERQVLRTIQARGPLSRAEVARHSGISAPTASKAVEALLRAGWLEEGDAPESARGRPARKLRLAVDGAQILGLVIDAGVCRLVSAGLDGSLHDEAAAAFPTPNDYGALLESATAAARGLMARSGVATLGLGISLPGLMNRRRQEGVLSPNVPVTNRQSPSADLTERLGIPCVMVQETDGLCLAERRFGAARGLDDFAMLDVSTGVGLGVISGGQVLSGKSGLAGEIGHVTVEPVGGRPCGCGNSGCLETVASDTALAWAVSQSLGRAVSVEEVLQLARTGEYHPRREVERTRRYLAVGLAAVINLFNPSTLFVHGRLFELGADVFAELLEDTRQRALPPSFADCRIVLARGSKRQGAIAAILEHLTEAMAPATFAVNGAAAG
jgi:predicted NBD/HSP70 family sugar kinase